MKRAAIRRGRPFDHLNALLAHALPQADDWTRYTQRQRGDIRAARPARWRSSSTSSARAWELRYLLRAEVPGKFHALPVLGQAMYVPEIRCNGAETRVTVEERAQIGD